MFLHFHFFLSYCGTNTHSHIVHIHLATDGPNMFDRGTLLFVPWVFQLVQFFRCSQSDYVIRLLLRSFVLIQSSPKGFWVNVCVCVPTFPLSFPYFVPVILFSLTICFSLVPSLLAAYQPPTNTGKPMQVHANTHTHKKIYNLLS